MWINASLARTDKRGCPNNSLKVIGAFYLDRKYLCTVNTTGGPLSGLAYVSPSSDGGSFECKLRIPKAIIDTSMHTYRKILCAKMTSKQATT